MKFETLQFLLVSSCVAANIIWSSKHGNTILITIFSDSKLVLHCTKESLDLTSLHQLSWRLSGDRAVDLRRDLDLPLKTWSFIWTWYKILRSCSAYFKFIYSANYSILRVMTTSPRMRVQLYFTSMWRLCTGKSTSKVVHENRCSRPGENSQVWGSP